MPDVGKRADRDADLWGRRREWDARRSVLRDGLRELNPNLVALPESIVTDEYDQVRDLLGDGFHVAHQKAREPGNGSDIEAGQGHSVASRWPLGEVRELDLHLTPQRFPKPRAQVRFLPGASAGTA